MRVTGHINVRVALPTETETQRLDGPQSLSGRCEEEGNLLYL